MCIRDRGRMVQFTLPKNSKITAGKTWARPAGARNPREYRVYRWNPDDGKNPQMDTYFVDLDEDVYKRQATVLMQAALS